MDKIAQVQQTMDFDPWGARRSTNWAAMSSTELTNTFFKNHSISNSVGTTALTSRGFTGHEMLDEVGVIHMNGRIYDAKLGRFLQADPLIQAPYNTQSLNRYSYGFNNPLNGIDPSGFGFFKDLFDFFVTVVIAIVCEGNPYCMSTLHTIYRSAVRPALFGTETAAAGTGISSAAFGSGTGTTGANAEYAGINPTGFLGTISRSTIFTDGEEDTTARIARISDRTTGRTHSRTTGSKFVNGGNTTSFITSFGITDSIEEVLLADSTLDALDTVLEVLDYLDIASDVLIVGGVVTGGATAAVGIPGKVLTKLGKKGLRELGQILRKKAASRAKSANKTSKETQKRKATGRDGGKSEQIIERDANDNVISRTHRVEKDGEIVHQHQNHIGKNKGVRQFPDEWTGTKTINAPYENHPPQFGTKQ